MQIKIATEPYNRSLKEILDEINDVASHLGYCDHRLIQEDLAEILRRYGECHNESIVSSILKKYEV